MSFLVRLNHSYGYPVANFLYPGFLYLGSFFHFLGASFVTSVKLIFGLSLAGSALFVFLWLRTGVSVFASTLGTVAFLTSPYLLFDLYRRGSVGEVLAFFAVSLGLYSVARRIPWLYAISIAFLLVAHNTLALLFIPVFFLYIVTERVKAMAIPLLLGFGGAAFFWIPALSERSLVLFDTVRVSDPTKYFASGNLWWLVGPGSIVAICIFFFQKRRVRRRSSGIFPFLFILSVFLALPVSLAFWNIEIVTKLIQFPYRLLSVSIFCAAYMVSSLMEDTKAYKRWALIAVFGILWLRFSLPIIGSVQNVHRPESTYATNEGTTTVADEYMPRWVLDKPKSRPASKVEFVGGGGTIVPRVDRWEHIDVDVTSSDNTRIQINTVYYPGWKVAIDGVPVPIDWNNPRGVMRVAVPYGTHRLQAVFRETPLRFIADAISLGSLLGIVGIALRPPGRKRKVKR